MANVFVDDASLQAIAGAIRAKNGSTETYKPGQMAAAIQAIETGGGLEINGIIDKYVVADGGSVSAGDFVQFVNEYVTGTDTQLSSTSNTGNNISAVELSGNRALIVHGSGSGSACYLYGIVVEVSGNTITAGVDTQLSTIENSGAFVKAVKVKENNVCIVHSGTAQNHLYATAVTVNGNAITAGSGVVVSGYPTNGTPDAVLTGNERVFVAYNTEGYLYSNLLKVQGTTVTVLVEKFLENCGDGLGPSVVNIGNSNVRVFFSYGTGKQLYMKPATVNGDTQIVVGTNVCLVDTSYAGYSIRAIWLADASRVLILHCNGSTYNLSAKLITAAGVKTGEIYTIAGTDSAHSFEVIEYANNVFLVVYRYGSNQTCRKVNITVSGDTMTSAGESALITSAYSGSEISAAHAGKKILIAHSLSSSYKLGAMVMNPKVKKISDRAIAGVAKTGGSAGATINVYVPN